MVELPEKISPLHDLAMPMAGDGDHKVELSERLCDSLVQVQAWPDTVSKVEGVVAKLSPQCTVMHTGPGRWLIESEESELEDGLRKSIPSTLGAVTDLTHGRVVVSIAGEKAEWVLATGIALDFSVEAFPVGSTKVSHHHETGLTIFRTGTDSFDLYVFTSLSRAFWGWIARASAEVGYSVG